MPYLAFLSILTWPYISTLNSQSLQKCLNTSDWYKAYIKISKSLGLILPFSLPCPCLFPLLQKMIVIITLTHFLKSIQGLQSCRAPKLMTKKKSSTPLIIHTCTYSFIYLLIQVSLHAFFNLTFTLCIPTLHVPLYSFIHLYIQIPIYPPTKVYWTLTWHQVFY